jgi:hypothetical protein
LVTDLFDCDLTAFSAAFSALCSAINSEMEQKKQNMLSNYLHKKNESNDDDWTSNVAMVLDFVSGGLRRSSQPSSRSRNRELEAQGAAASPPAGQGTESLGCSTPAGRG